MRFLYFSVFLLYALTVEIEGTILRDTVKTLPTSFLRANWSAILRRLWLSGEIWQLPKNTAITLFRLLSSSPDRTKPIIFSFKPDDGVRASYEYQRRFGYRGQRLIELLGTGFGAYRQVHEQQPPVIAFSLMPPRPF